MRLLLVLWVIAVLAVVACAGSEPTQSPMPTPAATSISTFEDMLRVIPDTPGTHASVFVIDYALMRELFDIPLPGPGANEEAKEQYRDELLAAWMEGFSDFSAQTRTPFLSDGYTPWEPARQDHKQYLGSDIRNEDQTLVAGVLPEQMEVLRGRFDPTAFDRALSTCSGECTPPDTQEEYKGVTVHSWGEDFESDLTKRLAPPAFDQLGRGGRIAVQDSYVFRTVWTDGMKALIDASLDKRPSLADWEDYRLVTQGMSELAAYGMFLSDQTQGFEQMLEAIAEGFSMTMNDQVCLRVGAEVQRQPMLRRYQVFATGVGKDEMGNYTALVLVHSDEGSATENAVLLRKRIEEVTSGVRVGSTLKTWAELFDTNRIEVDVKGRVLLAKLRPTERTPPYWLDWVLQQDPLLLHEPAPGFVLPTPEAPPPAIPTATPVPALPATPTPVRMATIGPTVVPIATPTPMPTAMATVTPTLTLTATPVPMVVPIATAIPTLTPTTTPVPTPASNPRTYDAPPPLTIDSDKTYIATLETDKGNMVIELFAKDAPRTVNNFVFLAREGYYDGTAFHRVIPGFVAQGGDPTGTGVGGPGYTFDDEISERRHETGTVSMANIGRPNTNGSQFFITYAPQPHLDGNHSVFGQLVEGMDVLNSLTPGDPSQSSSFIGDTLIRVIIEER